MKKLSIIITLLAVAILFGFSFGYAEESPLESPEPAIHTVEFIWTDGTTVMGTLYVDDGGYLDVDDVPATSPDGNKKVLSWLQAESGNPFNLGTQINNDYRLMPWITEDYIQEPIPDVEHTVEFIWAADGTVLATLKIKDGETIDPAAIPVLDPSGIKKVISWLVAGSGTPFDLNMRIHQDYRLMPWETEDYAPEEPVISTQPVGATVNQGKVVTLTVGVDNVSGQGELSYQWYSNTSNSNSDGTKVGDNSATYSPVTSTLGTTYYYVEVTNTLYTTTSNVAPVLVTEFNLPDELTITTIYEGDTWFNGGKVGNTVYQGGRVTLKTEYYTGIALPTGGRLSFEWYSCDDPDDPTAGRVRAATDKWDLNQAPILGEYDGNIYIPDTSEAGTNYYYVEITFTPSAGVPVTIQSEIAAVKVESISGTLEEGLLTPAELSGWRRTTSSAEVYAYCQRMAGLSDGRIRMVDMTETAGSVVSVGLKVERQDPKKVPMLIVGYPTAPASYEEAIADGKTIALVNCNIHSGEIEGKESMLIFAREIALGYHDTGILEDMVILIIPNFNADGNDDLGTSRNNTQYTPRMMGTRYTGALWNPVWTGTTPQLGESNNYIHYNINRDMTKLDGKESTGMVAVMNEWDPVIFIDAHATNGSLMRHAVTYNWGLHPNTDPAILAYNRGEFSTKALGKESYLYNVQDKLAVPYGNFLGSSNWNTFDAVPRYTTNYSGLRNRLAMLLEVYSHDPYTVRVDTQYACIYGTLLAVQENADHIKQLIADADEYAVTRAEQWEKNGEKDQVSLLPTLVPLEYGEHESIKPNGKMDVTSYKVSSGLSVISTTLRSDGANSGSTGYRVGTVFAGEADLEVTNNGKFTLGTTVDMGAYYLFDADCTEVAELMVKHGIEMTQMTEPLTLTADKFQWFNVTNISTADPSLTASYYEGRLRTSATTSLGNIRGSWQPPSHAQVFPAGTYVVSTAQVRGALAALLLEPASIDGAACWNLVDAQMADYNAAGMVRSNEDYACTVTAFGGIDKTVSMPIFKVGSFDALTEDVDDTVEVVFYDEDETTVLGRIPVVLVPGTEDRYYVDWKQLNNVPDYNAADDAIILTWKVKGDVTDTRYALSDIAARSATVAADLTRDRLKPLMGRLALVPLATMPKDDFDTIHYGSMVVDGHMDAPMRIVTSSSDWRPSENNDLSVVEGRGNTSQALYPWMKQGGMSGGLFAAYTGGYTTEDYTRGSGDRANSRILSLLNATHWSADRNQSDLTLVLDSDGFKAAFAADKLGIMQSIEGAYSLTSENCEELIEQYYDLGVRVISFTWNSNSYLAAGNLMADPSPYNNTTWAGMSELGYRALAKMDQLGIVYDVSHSDDQTVRDALNATSNPIIASHSGARAVYDNLRNLWDPEIIAIARSGGAIFQNLYGDFIEEPRSVSEMVDQIDHIRDLLNGEGFDWSNHVCIGSDYDGGTNVADANDARYYYRITKELLARGYTEQELTKVFGTNAFRIMDEVQGNATATHRGGTAAIASPKADSVTLGWGESYTQLDTREPAFSATVTGAESARIIVDGIVYPSELSGGTLTASLEGKPLQEAFHVVTFEAADSAGKVTRDTKIFYVGDVAAVHKVEFMAADGKTLIKTVYANNNGTINEADVPTLSTGGNAITGWKDYRATAEFNFATALTRSYRLVATESSASGGDATAGINAPVEIFISQGNPAADRSLDYTINLANVDKLKNVKISAKFDLNRLDYVGYDINLPSSTYPVTAITTQPYDAATGQFNLEFFIAAQTLTYSITDVESIVTIHFTVKDGVPMDTEIEGNLNAVQLIVIDATNFSDFLYPVVDKDTAITKLSESNMKYNTNGDEKFDELDITNIVNWYYLSSEGDDKWAAAKKYDVNSDGFIDLVDIVLLYSLL